MSSKMMGFDEFPQIARTETARAIYLIDVDTCEIVYMNKSAKDMLQLAYEDDSYCGKKMLYGFTGTEQQVQVLPE